MSHIYDAEAKHLEPWKDSPGEIAKHDWRDFLGKREYEQTKTEETGKQLTQRSKLPTSLHRLF